MAASVCKLLSRLTLSSNAKTLLTSNLSKTASCITTVPSLANPIPSINLLKNVSILQKTNLATLATDKHARKDEICYRFNKVEELKRQVVNDLECNICDDDIVKKIFGTEFARQSELNRLAIHEAIKKYQMHPNDYGSSPVQVAILTTRIHRLRYHMTLNKKDKHNRRRLLMMIDKRKKHLNYLKRKDFTIYCKLLEELLIRPTIKHKYGKIDPIKRKRRF
ncbi:30S ribosomal protein S15 [Trichoplax sp. H2]|nr:30S ribosomal protein S15 [Trichoplax sp. H2]|eukprot:RDD43619.1 30S ribosomal protein S15 [Trichoplax sp. H2]